MPETIFFAILSVVGALGPTLGPLLGVVLTIGVVLAPNLLLNALFGPKRPRPSDGQQTARQAIASRVRNYGIVHTGGTLTFFDSSNGTLGQVVTLGTGREAGVILEHRINDKVVTVSGSTVTDASFHGALTIYTRSGDPAQSAISEMTTAFPAWTGAHRQRGCAHAALIADPVKQELFSEVYNGQVPQYTQVRKACVVYDPRKDSTRTGGSGAHRLGNDATYAWSDNAVLVIGDYLSHPDGFGLGNDAIDWDQFAEEADICDETVATVRGETVARWRIWASYSLTQRERRQVLADMLTAIDGFCWQGPDGKIKILAGRYIAPTVNITDAHIKAMAPSLGPQSEQRVSALKMLYTEAANAYREQESALVSVPGVNADPNTDVQAVELYYAPHHNQAVRIGKLQAAALSQRWHVPVTIDLFGLNLLGQRFVRFESEIFGVAFDAKIESLKLNLGAMQVDAVLTEVRPDDWDFNAAIDEGTPPSTAGTTTTAAAINVPTGLTLSAFQIALGNGFGVAIAASWDFARYGLIYLVRYRSVGSTDWAMMTVDNEGLTATSGQVNSGSSYEVQVRAQAFFGRASNWSASVTIVPTASTVLAAPTSLTATGSAGSAAISFRMPTSATLAFARLYSNTTSSFGSATQVGSDIVGGLGAVISVTDSGLSPGPVYYWVRAFNGVGGSSALAGPVSATIT